MFLQPAAAPPHCYRSFLFDFNRQALQTWPTPVVLFLGLSGVLSAKQGSPGLSEAGAMIILCAMCVCLLIGRLVQTSRRQVSMHSPLHAFTAISMQSAEAPYVRAWDAWDHLESGLCFDLSLLNRRSKHAFWALGSCTWPST